MLMKNKLAGHVDVWKENVLMRISEGKRPLEGTDIRGRPT
jgi:hypothetical protein